MYENIAISFNYSNTTLRYLKGGDPYTDKHIHVTGSYISRSAPPGMSCLIQVKNTTYRNSLMMQAGRISKKDVQPALTFDLLHEKIYLFKITTKCVPDNYDVIKNI